MDGFQEAKELYFRHEGSRFYMNRNGVEEEFLRYDVPEELLRRWQSELKQQKLAMLDTPEGSRRVIGFLLHHSQLEHLTALVRTPPQGRLLDRLVYLENLLEYIDTCAGRRRTYVDHGLPGYAPAELDGAVEYVLNHARNLLRRARAATMVTRINKLISDAEHRLPAADR